MIELKKVDTSDFTQIDVLVGMSGKMYIPTIEDLEDESFMMVLPYKITTGQTPQEVKLHWENAGTITFKND